MGAQRRLSSPPPQWHAPQVWAMVTMVIGGFFLSFCFGRIASVVSKLDADRAARAEQMENVTQFLKDTELPKHLSRRYCCAAARVCLWVRGTPPSCLSCRHGFMGA